MGKSGHENSAVAGLEYHAHTHIFEKGREIHPGLWTSGIVNVILATAQQR